ncbi:DUF3369 domain-containing protein [Azospirillum sp. sgz302134]
MSDDFLFCDDDSLLDEPEAEPAAPSGTWTVLIVDDDAEVHAVTRFSLRNVTFRGHSLELLSAYSGKEAREILRERTDIALILLDVVMETSDAGLQLVQVIREEMKNRAVRIVLRTGQPGQAPEDRVIVDYDINDYKAKTELTAQKLFTTVIAALRAYNDIMTIEASREGLRKIITSSARLVERNSLREFASGVLTQISALLDAQPNGIICAQKGVNDKIVLLAGVGRYTVDADGCIDDLLSHGDVVAGVREAFERKSTIFGQEAVTVYIPTDHDHEIVAWVVTERELSESDHDILRLFLESLSSSFSNAVLFEKLQEANEDLERRVAEANARLGRLGEAPV